jgi:hypothetical protein
VLPFFNNGVAEEALMREILVAVLVSLGLAMGGPGAFAQELKAGNATSTLATIGAQMTADAPSSPTTAAGGSTSASVPGNLNAATIGLSSGLATPGQVALGSMKAPPAMADASGGNATPSSAANASLASVANIAAVEPQSMSSKAGIDAASAAKSNMSGLTSGLTAPALGR